MRTTIENSTNVHNEPLFSRGVCRNSISVRSTASFTLIELLVVIAIIAILASILMPALSSARERAKTMSCAGNIKEMGSAMFSYTTENNGFYPWGQYDKHHWAATFYKKYIKNRKMWKCPNANMFTHNYTHGDQDVLNCAQENLESRLTTHLTYGYNYLGFASNRAHGNKLNAALVYGVKVSQVQKSSMKILFGENCRNDSAGMPRYDNPTGNVIWNQIISTSWSSLHNRHNGGDYTNIGWADGHGTTEYDGRTKYYIVDGKENIAVKRHWMAAAWL